MYELSKATAYGYGLGKVIQIANGMQVLPRMAMLGATGFLTTGWKAPLEDRLAAATVFGLAGGLAPWAEGKSITRMSADAQLRYKQLTGKMPGKEALLGKADKMQADLNKAEAMLSEHSKWQERFDGIKKAEANGKSFKPLTREEKAKQIKDPNKVYRLRQEVLNSQEFLLAHYKALYTTKEYSPAVLGADLRGPRELKYELINPDGTAKYKDMGSSFIDKSAVFLKSGKFIGKDYPLFKWVNDTVTRYVKKAEIDADRYLYDSQQVPKEHGTLLRGQKEGEPFVDYLARNESNLEAVGAMVTARRAYVTQKSYGAALTRYEILMHKEPAKAKQIADVFIRAESDKMSEAKANEEKINTQNKDGTLKYKVTDYELSTKYNLNFEQIRIFREISNTLETVIDFYNTQVLKFGNVNKDLKAIPKLPNYFPHIFPDKFNTWILKTQSDGTKVPVANIGTSNRWNGLSLERELKKHPLYGQKEYTYNTVSKKRYPYGNLDEISIYDTLRQFDIRGLEKEAEALTKLLSQTKGPKFRIKRADPWKEGFKGSELYMLGRKWTKKMAPNLAQANDFADVIKSYVKGVTSMSHKMEADVIIKDALEHAPAMDIANSKKIKSLNMLYPNTAKAARIWADNAMGRAQPKEIFKMVDNIGSRWIGESGLSDLLGAANQITLSWKLLFGNARFIAAQAIQPYHMIFPKLVELKYQGMEKGSITMAQLKSLRDLFFPDVEVREAIKYFKEQGLVEPKFLREFSGTAGVLNIPKIEALGNYMGDFAKLGEALTLRSVSAKVEQVSRLNAGIMFYNFLRSAGHNANTSKVVARYLADQYMVEYNHLEKPLIYGDQGLGTIGKPFGLFKTFQHNYLSQLVEHVNTYKHTGQSAPMVAFFAQMIFAAGLFGVIGIETADTLLEKLSPTLEKFTKKPIPTIKEAIATSSYPDVIKHGIPSGMTGIDFTTTLAAPGTDVTDLVSVPTLDMWGLNPLRPWNKRGILPSGVNLLAVVAGTVPNWKKGDLERKQAWVEFLKTSAPTSLQFAIEQYYNGLPVGYDFINTEMMAFIDWDAYEGYKDGPTRDPFKKGRGIYKRNAKDWLARKMAAYSIEEREATKLMYIATRVKSDLKASLDTILTTSAHHFMRDGFIPEVYFNEAYKYGEDPKSFIDKVLNRIELQQSDFLTRALKQTDSKGHIERLREIREIIESKYMYRN
jgi:hypothetical protein